MTPEILIVIVNALADFISAVAPGVVLVVAAYVVAVLFSHD